MSKRIKRGLLLAILSLAVIPATAAAHIQTSSARNFAGNYAMNHWDPLTVLPYYSLAESWDGVSGRTRCVRFSGNKLGCVVGVLATDYTYDSFGDPSGYAWCVGTVIVKKHYGLLYGHTTSLQCESTDDLDS